ncbi:MAG: phage tail sheath family protein [Vallitalea sp.]|nr:phage tail sheath family protein [Vallitalea sp.]
MAYEHGISVLENPTPTRIPVITNSGIQVVIGTAPVNQAQNVEDAVNKPIICYSWEDAVSKLGYSDDWDKYTLCQAMDASFKRLNVAPVVFINVLNPSTHKASITDEKVTILNKSVVLKIEGVILNDTFKVKNATEATTYIKDTDYNVAFNELGQPVVSIIESGTIPSDAIELKLDYEKLDPSTVTEANIIGGIDGETNEYSGIEVISLIYPMLGLVPGMLLAPGWSHKPNIAAVLDAKCRKINGSFNCINILDIDSNTIAKYQDVSVWKKANNYTSKYSIVLWPKVKIGLKTYYYSAIIAALMAHVDAENDNVPHKSPSNKKLPIIATVANNKEVFLDQLQGNFLNSIGVITAINMNGWRTWGNNTAAYPDCTDPKDRFISIRRIFDWWGNTFINKFYDKVDEPTNYRLIESILDDENIRANGLQAKGQIAGAKMEFRQQDNSTEDILNGRIQFVQKISAYPPAESIVNILEFDPSYISKEIFGGDQ